MAAITCSAPEAMSRIRNPPRLPESKRNSGVLIPPTFKPSCFARSTTRLIKVLFPQPGKPVMRRLTFSKIRLHPDKRLHRVGFPALIGKRQGGEVGHLV